MWNTQKKNCFSKKLTTDDTSGSDHFKGKRTFFSLRLACSDDLLFTCSELRLILQCSLIFHVWETSMGVKIRLNLGKRKANKM